MKTLNDVKLRTERNGSAYYETGEILLIDDQVKANSPIQCLFYRYPHQTDPDQPEYYCSLGIHPEGVGGVVDWQSAPDVLFNMGMKNLPIQDDEEYPSIGPLSHDRMEDFFGLVQCMFRQEGFAIKTYDSALELNRKQTAGELELSKDEAEVVTKDLLLDFDADNNVWAEFVLDDCKYASNHQDPLTAVYIKEKDPKRPGHDCYYFGMSEENRISEDGTHPLYFMGGEELLEYSFPEELIRFHEEHDALLGPYTSKEIEEIHDYLEILGEYIYITREVMGFAASVKDQCVSTTVFNNPVTSFPSPKP